MVLEFENDRATVEFTPEEGIAAESYKMNVYARDKTNDGEKKYVFTSKEYPLIQGVNNWYIIIDFIFYNEAAKKALHISSGGSIRQTGGESNYGNTLPTIIEFSFSVLADNEESEVDDILEVHFVRYIPKLMNILGHTNGENLQRIWFTEGNNTEKEDVDPMLDVLEWDALLNESHQARREYLKFKYEIQNDLISFASRSTIKEAIRYEINKMVTDNLISLPTSVNPITRFGVTDQNIVTYKEELMPAYEKYYVASEQVGLIDRAQHIAIEGLDDHISTLANFNFHFFVMGELEYKHEGFMPEESINITIQQLGFYIKDQYDFEDEDPTKASQPLGFWKIIDRQNIDVKPLNIINKNEYYRVSNSDYRTYRETHSMGYNYFLYSTIHYDAINMDFEL